MEYNPGVWNTFQAIGTPSRNIFQDPGIYYGILTYYIHVTSPRVPEYRPRIYSRILEYMARSWNTLRYFGKSEDLEYISGSGTYSRVLEYMPGAWSIFQDPGKHSRNISQEPGIYFRILEYVPGTWNIFLDPGKHSWFLELGLHSKLQNPGSHSKLLKYPPGTHSRILEYIPGP